MTTITLIVLVLGLVALTFTWSCELCVLITRRRHKNVGDDLPAISVLKPLKGADEDLYDNLVSFATQDYPRFELVFACEEISDPALRVVRRLQEAYPSVPIAVVAGGKPVGYNPKINNLSQAAAAASHDLLLISDADVRVDPNYLRAVAAELADSRVGLVSNPIVGVGEQSLGSALDNLHLNTFVLASVCAAPVFARHACVVGKSMLFRHSEFLRLGGWAKIKDVLAEDYVLGQLYQQAGYRVALSSYAIRAVNRRRSVADFARRHVRWGQMRRKLAGPLYWLEPMMLPSAWLALAMGLILVQQPSATLQAAFWIAGSACALRLLGNLMLVRVLRGGLPGLATWVLAPLKDLLVVGLWLFAAVDTTVNWRGNRFRIGAGSVLSPLLEPGAEAVPVQLEL
jgi:ceramide glucosyltransferase